MASSKHRSPLLLGIFAKPGKLGWLLGILPFLICIFSYSHLSKKRLDENPNDKLTPSWSKMVQKTKSLMTVPDRRTGELVFWDDTKHSLVRLLKGISLAALVSIILAILLGLFPAGRELGQNFVNTLSFIPPVAILPILLVAVGVGETSKVALIFIGTFPLMTRDLTLYVQHIPKEQIIKTMTLGANQWQLVYKVVLPQLLPKIIETVRLSIGAGWIFLIVAEGIASSEGLGYRIFQARRYMAMDTIIPYVLWITLLAFLADTILRLTTNHFFKWYKATSKR
ncbi:ABC transporter permease [Rubritalea tangerina]|uniref:ABC transporter permease n=1 Tax=Rubritalea tangerina TaxID=430798 RepID=A0ABW4ZB88_9BACT